MPAYANPPDEPAKLTGSWQATGRTRLRSWWFGILVCEAEESAVVQVGHVANGSAIGRWQEVKRWRRARRGHVIKLGTADVLRAFAHGKAERH